MKPPVQTVCTTCGEAVEGGEGAVLPPDHVCKERHELRIVSDGTRGRTFVELDGRVMRNVRRVSWELDPKKGGAVATLELLDTVLDVRMPGVVVNERSREQKGEIAITQDFRDTDPDVVSSVFKRDVERAVRAKKHAHPVSSQLRGLVSQ